MTGVIGDFMRQVNSYQHGDFFIAVYEINSCEGADCFYGWESDDGSYIGLCSPTLTHYDPDSPAKFSLCLGSSPGDVIFRFDDLDGKWMLALAARLSEHLAKLEMPAEVRECLQHVVQNPFEVEEADGPGTPLDGQLNRAICTVRDWLRRTS